MSRGAASLPQARQAARGAPANRPPVRFPAIARSDGNEPGATCPSGCDGRPEDQRICPQTEATGGRAPATPPGLGGCAVPARTNASKKMLQRAPKRRETGRCRVPKERAVTTPKTEPRPVARTRVPRRVPLGVVTAGDPSQQPGPRNGVNGPLPSRPAGGCGARGAAPLGGTWRSQVPTVNLPKSRVQRRVWQRGVASAECRRSRRPALTGPGPVPRPATSGSRWMYRRIHR